MLAPFALEFPSVWVEVEDCGRRGPAPAIPVEAWHDGALDLWGFDRAMDEVAARGPFHVTVAGEEGRLPAAGFEVLTRCQRLLGRRNEHTAGAVFDDVLERHRALHDLDKPLVRADYDHALDTWQWTLRLDPGASLAVQVAALFHDVERLGSEAEARVEHRAADYRAFKDDHARRGAELADPVLAGAGLGDAVRRRVARLIAGHERAPEGGAATDPELALLNEADALSFFSLNSPGYVDYYGREAARRKVAYTLGRMGPVARRRAERLRLRPDVADLLREGPTSPAIT